MLGPNPLKGKLPNLWTECGCFPKPEAENMILPTPQEKITAILAARQDVAEFLQSIDKIEVMSSFSKDEIAGLIRAAMEGVQRSLREQTAAAFGDERQIPF